MNYNCSQNKNNVYSFWRTCIDNSMHIIHTETYSRKSHIVKFRTQMSFSQWEAANDTFYTRKNPFVQSQVAKELNHPETSTLVKSKIQWSVWCSILIWMNGYQAPHWQQNDGLSYISLTNILGFHWNRTRGIIFKRFNISYHVIVSSPRMRPT